MYMLEEPDSLYLIENKFAKAGPLWPEENINPIFLI